MTEIFDSAFTLDADASARPLPASAAGGCWEELEMGCRLTNIATGLRTSILFVAMALGCLAADPLDSVPGAAAVVLIVLAAALSRGLAVRRHGTRTLHHPRSTFEVLFAVGGGLYLLVVDVLCGRVREYAAAVAAIVATEVLIIAAVQTAIA